MCSAMDLSKYIITKCTREGEPISNLQLQKILYYIQKSFLENGKLAFEDDIEAWQFGPVVPEVYYHFCGYGAMAIGFEYKDVDMSEFSEDDMSTINEIVESKRLLKPWDMVKETHKKDGAWDRIYNDGLGDHKVIPQELIQQAG